MEKEYGGYLPLELSKGRPYYTGEDVIALNAGRYAITYAIEDAEMCIRDRSYPLHYHHQN